jgi:SNF2 family DNA or RNA helicase
MAVVGGVLSDDMGLGKTLQVRTSSPALCICGFLLLPDSSG